MRLVNLFRIFALFVLFAAMNYTAILGDQIYSSGDYPNELRNYSTLPCDVAMYSQPWFYLIPLISRWTGGLGQLGFTTYCGFHFDLDIVIEVIILSGISTVIVVLLWRCLSRLSATRFIRGARMRVVLWIIYGILLTMYLGLMTFLLHGVLTFVCPAGDG